MNNDRIAKILINFRMIYNCAAKKNRLIKLYYSIKPACFMWNRC